MIHTAPAATLDAVLSLYGVRHETDVRRFLASQPFLLSLLMEAHQAMQDHIGPGTLAVLEVVQAPGDTDGGELFVLAQVSGPPREALGRLQALDQEWWLEASERANCQMNVSLEFV